MLIVERLFILFKPYFGSFLYYDVIRHVTDPQKVFESISASYFQWSLQLKEHGLHKEKYIVLRRGSNIKV